MRKISIDKQWFKDESGRTVIIRGINLGGDSKIPYPKGGTNYKTDFSDHKDVSFINRPFPLEKADEHFSRLKNWGFNCIRLLTTWEAVEHKGPFEFDKKYLDYYANICEIAGEYGFYVIVDFHQDVWSRMTGGDGAPCWLFEKVGIDYKKISTTNSALVMQYDYDYSNPEPWQEENYPPMCWFQNKYYPASCIMYTLFFGGKYFARNLIVEGENIQDYMQKHFFSCQREVAKKIKKFTNVIGFDTLNEPSPGWIGTLLNRPINKALNRLASKTSIIWKPIDGLYSSNGNMIKLPVKGLIRKHGVKIINRNKESIWLEGYEDPFQNEGAWKIKPNGSYEIIRNDFFQIVNGKKIDFNNDCLSPFFFKIAENIRNINPDWILFIEKDPYDIFNEYPKKIPINSVNSSHWYDAHISKNKKYNRFFTLYKFQLNIIKKKSNNINDGCPTLIGEFGIPFNIYNGLAYKKYKEGNHSTDIWIKHIQALDKMYDTIDSLLINSNQWNYTATNNNNPLVGDGWNQEDFSIYSDDQKDNPGNINSGGRAVNGFVRPFPYFIQGVPLNIKFNQKTGDFLLKYQASVLIKHPTEVFIPNIQYPNGYEIEANDVKIKREQNNQRAILLSSTSDVISVRLKRKSK